MKKNVVLSLLSLFLSLSAAYNDIAAAYQLALCWKISGDAAYANKSIEILQLIISPATH